MGSSAQNSSGVHWCRRRVRFNEVPGEVPEKVWEALVQSQVRFNRVPVHLTHGSPAEVFPALGFPARFRKTCKNKTFRLLGIPPRLIFFPTLLDFLVTTSIPHFQLVNYHHISSFNN